MILSDVDRARVLEASMKLVLCGALLGLSACSNLPRVMPPVIAQTGSDESLSQAQIVRTGTNLSAKDSKARIREVQAEGNARLLAHHISLLGPLGEVTTSGNEVRLLVDGPATFSVMLADLERAKSAIQMESYIFEDESLGIRIGEILKRKALAGLQVRLIYDALGSFGTSRAFFDDLEKSGVLICQFNPVDPTSIVRLDRLNHRDHRKITVVDSHVAFTGGINISDVYSAGSAHFLSRGNKAGGPADAPKKGWRDTGVRIQGPAVADFSRLFAETWQRQGCAQVPTPLARQKTLLSGERLVTVLGSTPDDSEPRIYRALLTAIGGAQRSVHMTMSYFVPDKQTVTFLTAAARRGVDVSLVLQGSSDSVLVMRAAQSYYQSLLDAGVKIYERSDTLLHAKTTVIDGVWSMVGSSNVDWRSFLHNDEVSVIVFGADFAGEMEQLFQHDVTQALRVTPEAWVERDMWRKAQEKFGRLFEYWL